MLNVIIPYKKDKHEGLELKYALRSIEKYLTGYGKVIIVGDLLKWFNCDYIPDSDFEGRKEYSIKEKIITACNNANVSEDFITWADDVYLNKPLPVTEIKYWYDHSLKEEVKRKRSEYKSTVQRTLKIFPGGQNFDVHRPIIFNKEKFKLASTWTEDQCIKSTYCNYLNIEGEQIEDIKVNEILRQDEIKDRIRGRLFFSTGPIAVDYNLEEVLKELYPEPSRWEK